MWRTHTCPCLVAVLYLNGTDSAASSRGADTAPIVITQGCDSLYIHCLHPLSSLSFCLFSPNTKRKRLMALALLLFLCTAVIIRFHFHAFRAMRLKSLWFHLRLSAQTILVHAFSGSLMKLQASNYALNNPPHSCKTTKIWQLQIHFLQCTDFYWRGWRPCWWGTLPYELWLLCLTGTICN